MRRLALTFIPLFLVACGGEPTAPNATRLSVPSSVSQTTSAAQVFQSRFDISVDWLL